MTRWATFDCYGTLIDWNSGIRAELARLWPDEDADQAPGPLPHSSPRSSTKIQAFGTGR